MVTNVIQALIHLDERSNRVLNIVKARYGLKDKSQAVQLVVQAYEEEHLEENFRPEYVEKLKRLEKERSVPVDDFEEHYGLK